MTSTLASRLSALYATLLGITVLVVIIASSIALVVQLNAFTGDIVIAKHEEARILADEYAAQGMSLDQAAPEIANELSGIGLRVAVYDDRGTFLAGDRTLHPKLLDLVLMRRAFLPEMRPGEESPVDPFELAQVSGGYVAFAPSVLLLFQSLVPYWRIVVLIALAAMALSWFIGRMFATQALRPISEVTQSLRALAEGDYTRRQFVSVQGDEIGTLTVAYNDAAASVAQAMNERRVTEDRMRQFVADAGHELRTPLTVIGGYIDVLRRGAIDEAGVARQILGTMAIEKEHMRGLIDRLMRLARLDSDTQPVMEAIDVSEFLRSQVEAARRLDERREVDYYVDGAAEVVADRAELGEAVWNLVENALKYGENMPIHLRAERQGNETIISVRDEGPGMSEAERLHAFERFYRGDQRGEITGTGLGLAIAKRAIDRAGGRIWIDSAPGRGTTVNIAL